MPTKKSKKKSLEAERDPEWMAYKGSDDAVQALRETTGILMEFGRELCSFKNAFVGRWVGPVPGRPGGQETTRDALAQCRDAMRTTMVRRQALDVLKWLHAAEPDSKSPLEFAYKVLNADDRNPDGKRRAEAYFALEKKAIAVLMGEEASDER
jgi:hypothetical protein